MLKRIILTLLVMSLPVVASATIYRWVDEKGITHFSDTPHKGAATVKLPKTETYSAPKLPISQNSKNPKASEDKNKKIDYKIAITSPKNDENFPPGLRGSINVNVSVEPKLQKGHRIESYLDGNVLNIGKTNFTLPEDISRGEHTVQAKVTYRKKILAESNLVKFYVQQHSIQNPAAHSLQNNNSIQRRVAPNQTNIISPQPILPN